MEEEHRRILREALLPPSRKKSSFKDYLLSMPNVGEDKDFQRGSQIDRPVEHWRSSFESFCKSQTSRNLDGLHSADQIAPLDPLFIRIDEINKGLDVVAVRHPGLFLSHFQAGLHFGVVFSWVIQHPVAVRGFHSFRLLHVLTDPIANLAVAG